MTVPESELPAPTEQTFEQPPAEAAAPEETIEIGDKVFKTQAEALAFARADIARRENEAAIAEAYRAGIQDQALATAPPPAQEDPAAAAMRTLGITEAEFYSDVPKALLKMSQKIREDVRAEVLSTVGSQSEDQRLWAEFFGKNPDLVGFEDDARVTFNKFEKEVSAIASTRGKDKAMDFLAQKTRAKFQEYIERTKPRTDLSNTPTVSAPGSQTNVTPRTPIQKPLSFAEQVKQYRTKRL